MKTTWKDYQKDIADDRYYYARSCIRQNFFPGSEAAFLNIIGNDLGRDIREDAQHTSCTGIGYHGDIVPLETIMTVVARQFSLMTEAGYENFIPSCITSFGIYSETLEMWHDFPEMEEHVFNFIDIERNGLLFHLHADRSAPVPPIPRGKIRALFIAGIFSNIDP